MPKCKVSVPGNPGDPPHPVTGKSVIKVANWILKGVQKAHHGRPELLPHFSAWQHFTGPVAVPQYVEDAGDRRFGDFDFNLRPVLWDVNDFVRFAMSDIEERDGAVVAECRGDPHFTLVATDGIPSMAPWILAPEYVFRIVWILPGDDGLDLQPGKFTADTNAWPAAMDTNREIAFYDVKPSRDGKLSWNSMRRVHQRAAEHKAHPERFDSGQRGIRSAQGAMYEGGAMSRGWQGQRAQAKHTGEANRLLVEATPAMGNFRWNAGALGPPPPPRPYPPQQQHLPPAAASASSSSSYLPPTAAASAPAVDGARADSLEASQLQSLAAAAATAPSVAPPPQPLPNAVPNAPPEPPSVAEAPPVAKAPEPPADPVLAAVPEGAPVNPVPAGVPKARQNWRAIVGDGRVLRQPRRDDPHTVGVVEPAVTTDTTRRSYTSWWDAGWSTGWSEQ